MMQVKVFEDNGGGIHAIVIKNAQITNIISGFEDGSMSKADFIEAAQIGFDYADDFDPENYSGLTMEDVAAETESSDDLIAEITEDSVELYPEKMGCAGMGLFEIEYI